MDGRLRDFITCDSTYSAKRVLAIVILFVCLSQARTQGYEDPPPIAKNIPKRSTLSA